MLLERTILETCCFYWYIRENVRPYWCILFSFVCFILKVNLKRYKMHKTIRQLYEGKGILLSYFFLLFYFCVTVNIEIGN